MAKRIDVNADLGEEKGEDAAIMRYISSCNIACGGHAGNSETIRDAIQLAHARGLRIGAHPSYPDRAGFGRLNMKISPSELENSLEAQMRLLTDQLDGLGIPLHHIKPHGALYNDACVDPALAHSIALFIKCQHPTVKLYAPYASKLADAAHAIGVEVWHEAFVDRLYHPDLTLVKRSEQGAVLSSWEAICGQVDELLVRQRVRTSDGGWKSLKVDTLCLHGDHPRAVDTAMRLSHWIQENGMIIG